MALEAALALVATWAGLRVTDFLRWRSVLEWLSPAAPGDSWSGDRERSYSAREIARMQEVAERHLFFRANCLERSLALWWQLRRYGIPSDLRIGGRKEGGRFEAHAWVESNGVVLNGSEDCYLQFVPFDGSAASLKA